MKFNLHIEIPSNKYYVFMIGFLFLIQSGFTAAQSVNAVQSLDFGNLILYGQGGTFSVSTDNISSTTGDIIAKGIHSQAVFEINDAIGTTVRLSYAKNVILKGNRGGQISLLLTDSSPNGLGSFIVDVSPIRIYLGGKLTVGPNIEAEYGMYYGSVVVDFIVNH